MKIKTLVRKQSRYIFNQLKTMSVCKISDKYSREDMIEEVGRISTPLIKNILENNFSSGSDMKALLCLFDTLITSSKIEKEKGLYRLSVTMKNWVKNMKKINVKSSEGYVYISDIISSDIQVIIKTSKNVTEYNNLVREYFMGIVAINNLRYFVPNFVYTLGAFLYPEGKKQGAFVVYERVPGLTLEKLLKNNKLTFSEFLNVFVQLLIALEIAQRKCSFCHYDLHVNNVILRPIAKPYKYSVVFDNERYDIIAKKYIPVIIDFGTSSIKTKGKTIGSYYYTKHGMMPYLVQGADMYKLLFHIYIHSQGNLQRQIGQLFHFYNQHDPYKILIASPEKLKSIAQEYVKKVSYAHTATFTPLNFLSWILNVSGLQPRSVTVTERNIYQPLKYVTTSQTYADIFEENGKEKAIELMEKCADKPDSYVMLKYIQKILKKSSGKSNNAVNTKLEKYKHELIKNDEKILEGFRNVQLPEEFVVRDYINQILSFRIDKKFSKDLINKFTQSADFVTKLAPYLQFLYTIREMGMEKRYRNFIHDFTDSDQFKFYLSLGFLIEKTRRWSTTLIESTF